MPLPSPTAGLLALAVLVAAHLFGRAWTHRVPGPRAAWLSAGGGVAVAYVFVHVLPDLAEGQETLAEALDGSVVGFVESHAYLIALAGLVTFYGLERGVRRSGERRAVAAAAGKTPGSGGAGTPPASVFWLHVAVFALYNWVVGYLLLHRDETGLVNLSTYTLAMALHFMVNDHSLAEHHGDLYHRRGRWVLAATIVAGYVTGLLLPISEAGTASLLALVAGATILNVMKEELPEQRRGRFWAFAAGAAGYAALLLAV